MDAVEAPHGDTLGGAADQVAVEHGELVAGLPAVGRALHISPDARVMLIRRLRLADGEPMALETLDVPAALQSRALGLRSFAELELYTRDGGLERTMLDLAGSGAQQQLSRLAPEWLTLPSGRKTRVNYTPGQPPWVASRLQDFFGMRETPRVGSPGIPLTVHLLAPNRRPVQMTQDLAGFWERLYPQGRKELSRRYPRHAWPENPYNTSKD